MMPGSSFLNVLAGSLLGTAAAGPVVAVVSTLGASGSYLLSRLVVRVRPADPPSQSSGSSATRGSGKNAAGAAAAADGSLHCELCGCSVAGGDAGWQTHVAGIRHRRQVAVAPLALHHLRPGVVQA